MVRRKRPPSKPCSKDHTSPTSFRRKSFIHPMAVSCGSWILQWRACLRRKRSVRVREKTMATGARTTIESHLGAKAESLLGFRSPKIAKKRLHVPGPDFIDRVWIGSDRNIRVLTNLQRLFDHGRLGKSGYMSILPVDQGIEHS